MKTQVLTIVSVLSLVLAAGPAFAQTSKVQADIPFNFVVNSATMPAGAYSISTVGMDGTLLIRGTDNKTVRLVNANYAQSNAPSTRTKLVFRCYGTRYFLSQIWTEGNDRGRQLPKTAAESEVARDFSPHEVILVASLR